MKKLPILLSFILITFSFQKTEGQNINISYNTFYDALSPYGQWLNYAPYGNVWVYNQRGFTPYYDNGYWAHTNLGWTWVSDFDWGWAPFHYGRWVNDFHYGWMWIPGYDWAPAWVSWSRYNNYYGWAPLGYGMDFYSYNNIPAHYWIYTQQQYLNSPYFRNYCLDRDQNARILTRAKRIENVLETNNTKFQSGPSLLEVNPVTKIPVQTLAINPVDRKGKSTISDQTLNVYNPIIDKTSKPVFEKTIPAAGINKQKLQDQKDQPLPANTPPSINNQKLVEKNRKKQSEIADAERKRNIQQQQMEIEKNAVQEKARQAQIRSEQQKLQRQRVQQAASDQQLQQQRMESQRRHESRDQQRADREARREKEQQQRVNQQREYRVQPQIRVEQAPRRISPVQLNRE